VVDLRVNEVVVWVFKGGCPTRGAPPVSELFSFSDDYVVSSLMREEVEFLKGKFNLDVVKAKMLQVPETLSS
jgi:hypothetical protein